MYSIDNIVGNLREYVFTNLDVMEPRHAKTFFRDIVAPFIMNCPESLYQQMLIPLISDYFNLIFAKLDLAWKTMEQSQSAAYD